MRTSWEAMSVGESGATAALAGFAAVRLLRAQAGARRTSRQQAALALGLSAAGASLIALHSLAQRLVGGDSAAISTAVGLPALVGQALTALLLVRKR